MTGVLIRGHIDSNGKDFAIEHVQDVEPILENNKALRTIEQRSDWGRHVASIPNVVMTLWLDEEWARGNCIRMFSREFDELVARKLKDPDWKWLRTDMKALQTGWST